MKEMRCVSKGVIRLMKSKDDWDNMHQSKDDDV